MQVNLPIANIQSLLQTAIDAAIPAGKAIMEIFAGREVQAAIKADFSPLTIADKQSHDIITSKLLTTGIPSLSEEGISIPYAIRKSWEHFWLIDPLDGTTEFVNKIEEFAVNIALICQQRPVIGVIYLPFNDCLYFASAETGAGKINKDVRVRMPALPRRVSYRDLMATEEIRVVGSRSHMSAETFEFIRTLKSPRLVRKGSSLKFLMLLENQADVYPRFGRTMEWDTAAAHAIFNAVNRGVYEVNLKCELRYNKPDLSNPSFIAF